MDLAHEIASTLSIIVPPLKLDRTYFLMLFKYD